MAANGKVKPDAVIVDGKEAKFPVGHYELRSYEGKKLKWTRLDGNATDALAALKLAQQKQAAIAQAKGAGVEVVVDTERVTIKATRDRYYEAAIARGATEAAEVVCRAVDDFTVACGKTYLNELGRDDVTKYHVALRRRGMSDRTISNRHANIRSFLLFAGLNAKTICGPAPKYEKQVVEVFERGQLKKFFASLSTDYDNLLFRLLLQTGLREQEAMHLEWRSVNEKAKTLTVRSNPRYEFKVKDSEQREVPLNEELLGLLKAYRQKVSKHLLVFGRREGAEDKPDGHLLRRLKLLVRSAGMNCGHCETCISKKECERWFLHKFRATYITTLLRNGLDLRTVMKLSGHSDLESVMRYLRPAEGKEVQEKVNTVAWF
jgi:integrase